MNHPIAEVLRFDEKNLGLLEIGQHDGPIRLVAHTGFAEEVGPFLFKMKRSYHGLGHYLSEGGYAGELEGKLVGYIRNIRIDKSLRGRGIGGAALDAATDAMGRAGIRIAFLHATPETASKEQDLLRFYERHGFEEFDDVDDGHVIMLKKIRKFAPPGAQR